MHGGRGRAGSPGGIEASWLPETRKSELRREFETRLAAPEAAIDPADRELDLAIERLRPR
jgi:hypothetical protein